MIVEKIIRRLYILYSGVAIAGSSAICIASLCGVSFSYHKFMFYLAFGLSALAFFFGLRLLSGTKWSKISAVIIMVLAFVLMAYSVYMLWL